MDRLVAELSSSQGAPPGAVATRRPPTEDELQELVDSPAPRLLVSDPTMLSSSPRPTGLRAWVEDVVVDEAARGQGVGETLTMEALRLAREAGARTVDLTVRPEREAAERLYRRLGFKRRDTSVYRRAFSERA